MSVPPCSRITVFCLLLSFLLPATGRSQTYRWDGQTAYPGNNNPLNSVNWANGTPPPQSDPAIGDDVAFGLLPTGPNIANTYQVITIPDNISLVLHDIIFDGTEAAHPIYRFFGGVNSSVILTNDLTLNVNNEAAFTNSVNINLTAGNHLVTVQTAPSSLSFYSNISGADASVTITGGGQVLLAGDNTFTGGVTVDGAAVLLGSSTSPTGPSFASGPVGTGTLTLTGATIKADTFTTLDNQIKVITDSIFAHDTGINAINITLNGAIDGAGRLILEGNNNIIFNGANYFWTGAVTIDSYSAQGVPIITAGTDFALGSGVVIFGNNSNAKLQFTSNTPVIYGLDGGTGDVAGPSQVWLGENTSNLTIYQTSDTTYRGLIDGSGNLTKSGSGTLAFTSHLLHLGSTSIHAGAIQLDGYDAQIVNSSVSVFSEAALRLSGGAYANYVNVYTQGTLTGTGSVGSAFIHADGILAPGNGIGALNFDHLELNPGSIVELQFQSPTAFDQVLINPSVATLVINATELSGEQVLLRLSTLDNLFNPGTATGFDPQHGAYTWTIFDASASVISGFTSPNQFLIDSSQFTTNLGSGTFDLVQSGETLQLTFTPVPEPSTYALLALGLGLVLFVSRRRAPIDRNSTAKGTQRGTGPSKPSLQSRSFVSPGIDPEHLRSNLSR